MCKTQTSVSHGFHRIRHHFVGCWVRNGRAACSCLAGCGGRTWTTSPQTQILLKASPSCRPWKTMKQWSKWSSKAEVRRWDTCQETRRVCAWLVVWQNQFGPQESKSKMLTPKTNSLTMLTKCGNHLHRWFSIMNFPMFSCGHSLRNRKQCRVADSSGKSEEGRAVAKPMSACLISTNLLSARQTSSDSGASHVPGNQELGRNSISGNTRTLVRDNVRNRATTSQQWQKTRLDHNNMQISDCRYVEKVFENLRQKLSLVENADVLNEKTHVLIRGLLMSTHQFIMGQAKMKIWLRTRTPISKSSGRCST